MFATFEGDAAHLIQAAKLDPDGTVNVRRLVAHHLGTPPRLVRMRGEAELVLVEGRPRIYVRSGTTPSRARWLACHELAHWWLMKTRQEEAWHAETQADVLGAMLVAPGRAITRAVRLVGRDPIRIATGHAPAALVEHHRALLRGEEFRWPDETTLRRALRQEIEGLRRVRITDEPRRVGLIAEVT